MNPILRFHKGVWHGRPLTSIPEINKNRNQQLNKTRNTTNVQQPSDPSGVRTIPYRKGIRIRMGNIMLIIQHIHWWLNGWPTGRRRLIPTNLCRWHKHPRHHNREAYKNNSNCGKMGREKQYENKQKKI